ncbi:MAG: response regulator transcription factor [Thermoguttaceae bacterium]
MPSERKIQILIADNHELVRCGLKTLLAGTEIKIVAEATTVHAALKIALEKKDLDVALLDVRLPDGDGLTALGRIKLDRPELPVLMFSAYDNPASIARAIALGASGFLLKGCSRDELLHTIRTVANGESIWSKEKLHSASRSLRTPRFAGTLEASLSDTEGEVLQHMAQGLTNKQIALAMDVSENMVKDHVKIVLRKLGVADRTQAALWAVRNDLV